MNPDSATDVLSLLEWRRTIASLYGEIRAAQDKPAAWRRWRQTRARLFREHPQSPIPADQRELYRGPYVYDYDPAWRLTGSVEPASSTRRELPTSTEGPM